MSLTVVHVVTVPESLRVFFGGQIAFMKRNGLAVHAITSPGPLLDEFAESENINVHPVKMQRAISPFRDFLALFALCRVLRKVRPDIVHAHTPKAGLLGMIAAWITRVPVRIYHLHGLPMLTSAGWRRKVLRMCDSIACRLSHKVLSVSRSVRDTVIMEGICRAEEVDVLCSGSCTGIDSSIRFNPARSGLSDRSQIRESLGVPEDGLIMGFVGRIARDKGIAELQGAWEQLREEFPSLHLLVLGGYDSRDPIDPSIVERLKADQRVHLVGQAREIQKYYAAFDVCVLPTYREGLPNVLLEAAAMECPVVATTVTGCVDAVVDGKTGKLVPPRNSEALAQATREYLDSSDLRIQHGRSARKWVQQEFCQETLWSAVLQEYHDLTAQKGISSDVAEPQKRLGQELSAA